MQMHELILTAQRWVNPWQRIQHIIHSTCAVAGSAAGWPKQQPCEGKAATAAVTAASGKDLISAS